MRTALTIPREPLTVELDVLVTIAKLDGLHSRLPELVVAAYDPQVRYLSRALLSLADRAELATVYEVRIGDVPAELWEAAGMPDADVILTVPGLRDALVDIGAPDPDRLVAIFEQSLNAVPLVSPNAIDRLVELARDREIMHYCAEVYAGLAEHDDERWMPALRHVTDLAAGIAA